MSGQVESGADISALRRFIGLTPRQFAQALGVGSEILASWEEGRLRPEGPALALLRIAARHPRVILESLRPVESAA